MQRIRFVLLWIKIRLIKSGMLSVSIHDLVTSQYHILSLRDGKYLVGTKFSRTTGLFTSNGQLHHDWNCISQSEYTLKSSRCINSLFTAWLILWSHFVFQSRQKKYYIWHKTIIDVPLISLQVSTNSNSLILIENDVYQFKVLHLKLVDRWIILLNGFMIIWRNFP